MKNVFATATHPVVAYARKNSVATSLSVFVVSFIFAAVTVYTLTETDRNSHKKQFTQMSQRVV